jgi:hypothetical protein
VSVEAAQRLRLERFARGFERRRRFFPWVLGVLVLLALAAAATFGRVALDVRELAAPLHLSFGQAVVSGPIAGEAPTAREVDLFHAATFLRLLTLPLLFLLVLPWLAWIVQRQDALLYDLWRSCSASDPASDGEPSGG